MSESVKERYLIIHGHFYQPPREDPWSGVIDRQDSAYPHHDWNARINAECYAANTDARTLDNHGRIRRIVNNYVHISHNFGPTLLSWMEKQDPETYARIIAADRLSMAANGNHGNALAQVYNHVILPLANTRDKRTQVLWGLADFRARYGREAEGMWLSETAVNLDTVKVLIECGVRFIVLSPTQAEAVRPLKGGEWQDVSNNSVDTSAPYLVKCGEGSLAVFFYDMDISKSVGFEHLLTSADNFRNRIIAAYRDEAAGQMVNIATDGESYGHHEPFANMCLATMISVNEENPAFRMTNYGWYLEKFPPVREVRLKEGNNGLGTAWSCAHGVGRWMEDCGCSGGGGPGWNQKWRGPLRHALDWLRDEIARVSVPACEGLLRDFWKARDGYINAITGGDEDAFNRFLGDHAPRILSEEERGLVRGLMEAQRYAMYMYTSCGWFFSEISGIETVQCLRYAARALEFARGFLDADAEEHFLGMLAHAASNIPSYGNGRRVYEELVVSYIMDGPALINQYVLERLLAGEQKSDRMYYYRIRLFDLKTREKNGGKLYSGTAELVDTLTGDRGRYLFYVLRKSRLDIRSWIKSFEDERVKEFLDMLAEENGPAAIERKMKDWFTRSWSLADLKFDYKEKLIGELFKSHFLKLHEERTAALDEYLELLDFYARMHIPVPEVERSSIEATLNNEIRRQLVILEEGGGISDFGSVARMLSVARETRLNVNRSTVEALFALRIGQHLDRFLREREGTAYNELQQLIQFANASALDYDRKRMENRVYQLLEDLCNTAAEGDATFIGRVLDLAGMLNIRDLEYRKRLQDRVS